MQLGWVACRQASNSQASRRSPLQRSLSARACSSLPHTDEFLTSHSQTASSSSDMKRGSPRSGSSLDDRSLSISVVKGRDSQGSCFSHEDRPLSASPDNWLAAPGGPHCLDGRLSMLDQSGRREGLNNLSMSLRDRIKHSLDPDYPLPKEDEFSAATMCEDSNQEVRLSATPLQNLIQRRLGHARGDKAGPYMY